MNRPGARPRTSWVRGAIAGVLAAVTAVTCGGEAPPGSASTGNAAEPQISGTAPAAVIGIPSVVALRIEDDAAASVVATDTIVMDQIYMQFTPGFLLLRPGQSVAFENSEVDAAHNVRVRHLPTDSTIFNVGVAQGFPYVYPFDLVGGYHVTCDIHPGMEAALYVSDAPLVTTAAEDGAFHFDEVAPGSYTVEVWSMSEPSGRTLSVEVTGDAQRLELR